MINSGILMTTIQHRKEFQLQYIMILHSLTSSSSVIVCQSTNPSVDEDSVTPVIEYGYALVVNC